MSILNWIAIPLAVVLWIIQLYIGHGIGMASSHPIKQGSPEDIYLDRLETARLIVTLGAILTLISQLIDVPVVKTVGLIIMVISFLVVAVVWLGLLSYRLPNSDVTEDDPSSK
jgi:hypothetical protein